MQSQCIRIRLKAFDYKLIDQSALEIVDTANAPALLFAVPFRFPPAFSVSTFCVRRTSTRPAATSSKSAPISA